MITSISCINRLVFVMEVKYVFYAVGTVYLNVISTDYSIKRLNSAGQIPEKYITISHEYSPALLTAKLQQPVTARNILFPRRRIS
jgi:hypothetical protein